MKGKKGQEALEWLMTYGWVILIACAALGVLVHIQYGPDVTKENSADYINMSKYCPENTEFVAATQNILYCRITSDYDNSLEQMDNMPFPTIKLEDNPEVNESKLDDCITGLLKYNETGGE